MHYLAPDKPSTVVPSQHTQADDPASKLDDHVPGAPTVPPKGVTGERRTIDDGGVRQEAMFPDSHAAAAQGDGEGEGQVGEEGDVVMESVREEMRYSDLTDAQILSLTQSLKEQEAARRPLISPIEPLAVLLEEYSYGSETVVQKIEWLLRMGWRGIRRTRGDGDCFYRSLAFSYVERLLLSPDPPLAVAMALSTLQAGRELLDLAGFQELVYEDFYSVLYTLISSILPASDSPHPPLNALRLLGAFQDPETSNSIVVYLRLLTSAYIRSEEDTFVPFLMDQETGEMMDVRSFCEREVEATGKEADHVQEMALARALKLRVDIAYLDNTPYGHAGDGQVDFVKFESEEAQSNGMHAITLLYRPGHFDILETRDVE